MLAIESGTLKPLCLSSHVLELCYAHSGTLPTSRSFGLVLDIVDAFFAPDLPRAIHGAREEGERSPGCSR